MKNPNTNKHLPLEERCKIEKYINKGFTKYQIANELNKSQSSILKEIGNKRVLKPRNIFNENPFNYIYLKNCKVCTIYKSKHNFRNSHINLNLYFKLSSIYNSCLIIFIYLHHPFVWMILYCLWTIE